MTLCPCGSDLSYADCCQMFHTYQAYPERAEQLMRSRYTAFVLHNVDYIVATTVLAQQPFLDKQAIGEWAKNTDWAGLAIVDSQPKVDKYHASVTFNAFFNTVTADKVERNYHHERSFFVKITDNQMARWYFLDPTVKLAISQKQPCFCGSGEKFKRCCGKFL